MNDTIPDGSQQDSNQPTNAEYGEPTDRATAANSKTSAVPDRLYFAANSTAGERTLHTDRDCDRLNDARSVSSCPATHPPRGSLCGACADHLTHDDLDAAREVRAGGERSKDDLPDHITTLQRLGGGEVYRCQTCGREGESPGAIPHHDECPEPEVRADGGVPQPEIGDRVTYIDDDKNHHRAVVVDECSDDLYLTVVTGEQGELGETYNWDVESHTSVYPHLTVYEGGEETHAFIPGWS